MNCTERRNEIFKTLIIRKHDTISHLAEEFGVSRRTLRRDIELLSLSKPIYTQQGRHGGGVYLMEDYHAKDSGSIQAQIAILQKLLRCLENDRPCDLSINEKKDLWALVIKHT